MFRTLSSSSLGPWKREKPKSPKNWNPRKPVDKVLVEWTKLIKYIWTIDKRKQRERQFLLVSPKATDTPSCSVGSSSSFYTTDGQPAKCVSSLESLNISCSCDWWGRTATAMTGWTWTHHDAFGLFVGGLLHQAGQLAEVSLVLLEKTWSSVAGHIHRLLVPSFSLPCPASPINPAFSILKFPKPSLFTEPVSHK